MINGVTILGVVAAVAAISGPGIAVWITRMSDVRKEFRARRMDIFRTLMQTRLMPIDFRHVGALNLIEIEFVNDTQVINAWRAYLNKLGEHVPPDVNNESEISILDQRKTLLTKLISEISKVLKFKVEQLDILEGNYIPQGWDDDAWEQRVSVDR